jgi:8-oxo-dGTP diphosphatase
MYHADEDIRVNNKQARGFVIKGDKILLMYREKEGHKYYVFPGGHMDKNEKPIETVEREIFEETTIKVKNVRKAFDIADYAKDKEIQYEYYFICDWKEGIPTLSNEEAVRCCKENFYKPMWVDLKDLSNLKLYSLAAKEWVLIHILGDKWL